MEWLALLGWNKEQLEEIRYAGYSFIKQGHYKEALTFFEALVVLTKSFYDLHTIAALYLELGDNQRALDYSERALALEPNDEPTRLNRVKALLLLGYLPQAIADARLLEKSPHRSIANEASALLLAYPESP